MKIKISQSISSLSGNTEKVAKSVAINILDQGYNLTSYNCSDIKDTINLDDTVIICFWCRKAMLDPKSKKLVDLCKGKNIIAIGTMGSYPDGEYGSLVHSNVMKYINQENKCLGVFLCQGKIPLKRTMLRRNLPIDHPHHLNDEGLKRHLESHNHPSVEDLSNASNFVLDILNQF